MKRKALRIVVTGALAVVLLFLLAAFAREVWVSSGDSSPDRLAVLCALDPKHPSSWQHGARLTTLREPRAGFVSTRVYELASTMLLIGERQDGRWYVVERASAF